MAEIIAGVTIFGADSKPIKPEIGIVHFSQAQFEAKFSPFCGPMRVGH